MPISKQRHMIDIAVIAIMVLAAIALIALVFFQIRPIKTVDIKVPVATDQASYAPGDDISGLFFGEVYYDGKVEVLREVFCKDFQGTIPSKDGDRIFKGISKPLKLNGESRYIGKLPADIPQGSNCVVQFINTYVIGTPFGERRISVDYYTQNFSIVSEGRRRQIECEAANGTDCSRLNPSNETATPRTEENTSRANTSADSQSSPVLYAPDTSGAPGGTTNNTTTNNSTVNNPPLSPSPAEPVTPPDTCRIRLLSICLSVL